MDYRHKKNNNYKKIYEKLEGIFTAVMIWEMTYNRSENLLIIKGALMNLFKINISMPVLTICTLIIITILILKYIKKIYNFKNNNIDNKPVEIYVESNNKISVNDKPLNSRILNYREDIFEGVKFKWDYSIVNNGYKIINLRPLCPLCKKNELEPEIRLEDSEIILTCFDCYTTENEYGENVCNTKAQLVYPIKKYDSLKKLAKDKIIYNALSLKYEEDLDKNNIS